MSPYLIKHRLQDIIAAIQVMGAYPRFTSRDSDAWDQGSSNNKNSDGKGKLGAPLSANSWYELGREHPEFFRTNKFVIDQKGKKVERNFVGLRWRWALDSNYSPDQSKILSAQEIDSLTSVQRDKLTRHLLKVHNWKL